MTDPNFNDWNDLTYTQAYCKEVLRWRPISSGGFAHATTQEVVYGEYIIPEGTPMYVTILPCQRYQVWQILRLLK